MTSVSTLASSKPRVHSNPAAEDDREFGTTVAGTPVEERVHAPECPRTAHQ
jgi:hypothetical protein